MMEQPNTVAVAYAEATEAELVASAKRLVVTHSVGIGEIASRLHHAHGWTDQQVADELETSRQTINYARRIFERFASRPRGGKMPLRAWKEILAWDDAEEMLDWAEDNGATFAEMELHRANCNGELLDKLHNNPAQPAPPLLQATDVPALTYQPVATPSLFGTEDTPSGGLQPRNEKPPSAGDGKPERGRTSAGPEDNSTQSEPIEGHGAVVADVETWKACWKSANELLDKLEEPLDAKGRARMAVELQARVDHLDPQAAASRTKALDQKPKRTKAAPVVVEDWVAYGLDFAKAKNHQVTAENLEASFDHYVSNGWKQNNGRAIKDWQATCRTSVRKQAGWNKEKGPAVETRETGIDWSKRGNSHG